MKPSDYIKNPCREDWSSMTGGEKAKHCEKCKTCVHDLTGMDQSEIAALYQANGNRLCGVFRLSPDAVKKPLVYGAGIASLALAACAPEEEVLMGDICPPPQETKAETKPKNEAQENPRPMLLGRICPPPESD